MQHIRLNFLVFGLSIFLFSLMSSIAVQAQQSKGSIVGQLTDAAGNPLGHLYIELPQLNINAISETDGKFEILDVPAGDWQLRVHSIGFQHYDQVITVRPGAVSKINIQLKDDIKSLGEVTVAAVKKTANQT